MLLLKREAEPLIKTAEYVTGLNRDELAERIAQKSPLSKKYDITGGDSSYSQYLTSKQPAMNAGNAKDSDYNVLSQLAYADKFSNDTVKIYWNTAKILMLSTESF